MKVLFDPLYTNRPDKCASTAKFLTLAKHLLEKYPDASIYWPVPAWAPPDSKLVFPDDERITYFSVDSDPERYRSYRRLDRQMERMIAHYGELWDWDVLVTNKTMLVPLYRQMAVHHSSSRTSMKLKKVMVLEDFPQLTFQPFAALVQDPVLDAQTMLGCYAADSVAVSSYWGKAVMLDAAAPFYGPAVMHKLRRVVQECTPKALGPVLLKTPEQLAEMQARDTFVLGSAGRMVSGMFEKTFKVMRQHWLGKSEKGKRGVKVLLTTQSRGTGGATQKTLPDFVEVRYAKREEFHRTFKDEVHLGLFFSAHEDYSMSMIEPMVLGAPYVVQRVPWAEASLGPDYPFFVQSIAEASALVQAFYEDYPGMYAQYAKWVTEWFDPELEKRNRTSVTSEFDRVVGELVNDTAEWKSTHLYPEDEESLVNLLAQVMRGKGIALTFSEAIHILNENSGSEFKAIKKKFDKDQFDVQSSFSSDRCTLRWRLKAFHGAVDGKRPGSLLVPAQ